MAAITVWTKQHISAVEELERTGLYRTRREHIGMALGEHAPLVLEVYDWLTEHTPAAPQRPDGSCYPVWVSFLQEATMLPEAGMAVLELSLDPALITHINIAKWGAMLNYSYLPRDGADALRHRKLLEDLGVSDAKAFMGPFYPQIKREILDSWQRLFDPSVRLGNDLSYGTIWEIRKEWIVDIRR